MTLTIPSESRLRFPNVQLLPLAVDYPAYRRQVIFQCFKWDPQVGDISTISDHACVLSPTTASRLSHFAETLASETMELEEAISLRPELFAELGIPRRLRSALRRRTNVRENHVRVMRFDFHPTYDGWALSEVNSDVPGGFAEASALPHLAAPYVIGTRAGGDVAEALVGAITKRIGANKRLALVHATAYADDRQVMEFLSSRLTSAGFSCELLAPDHLRWDMGLAVSIAQARPGPIDGVVRFFPAEWLPKLPRYSGWRSYFDNATFSCNPARAVLCQSKRLPLVWDRLGVAVPTWRTLLPETRDPRQAPWRRDEDWLLKPAFGRVGEGIVWRGGVERKIWRRTKFEASLMPRAWVAQRRFQSQPLRSRTGPRHLCIGVLTIDGKAAGFYGRLSVSSIIERHAQDIPVLIVEEPVCR
jgi:glutathionylspermidine synthase